MPGIRANAYCLTMNENAPSQTVPKLTLSKKEAAQALGVCTATLDNLVKRGLVRPIRAIRFVKFTQAELERFCRENAVRVQK